MLAFRSLAKIGLIGVLLAIAMPNATAHTELISTIPAAASVVSEKPQKIVLAFSEAPILAGSFIQIEQPSGEVLGKEKPQLAGASLVIPWLTSIKPGVVIVRWRAVADDGHVSIGSFDFTYQKASSGESLAPVVESNNSSQVSARWAAGIVLIILLAGISATTRRRK